jgi:hypothetical protein
MASQCAPDALSARISIKLTRSTNDPDNADGNKENAEGRERERKERNPVADQPQSGRQEKTHRHSQPALENSPPA